MRPARGATSLLLLAALAALALLFVARAYLSSLGGKRAAAGPQSGPQSASACLPPADATGAGSGQRAVFVTYGGDSYAATKRRLMREVAENSGGAFNLTLSFGPENIPAQFYHENEAILSLARGGGYWLWKPYFILQVLGCSAARGRDLLVVPL